MNRRRGPKRRRRLAGKKTNGGTSPDGETSESRKKDVLCKRKDATMATTCHRNAVSRKLTIWTAKHRQGSEELFKVTRGSLLPVGGDMTTTGFLTGSDFSASLRRGSWWVSLGGYVSRCVKILLFKGRLCSPPKRLSAFITAGKSRPLIGRAGGEPSQWAGLRRSDGRCPPSLLYTHTHTHSTTVCVCVLLSLWGPVIDLHTEHLKHFKGPVHPNIKNTYAPSSCSSV